MLGGNASNVTGEVLPLAALAALAHPHGARIVADAAQLAPHRRIDLAAADVDYVARSGHKLYAPFGAGALVGRRDWLDFGRPHLPGGGAVRGVTLDGVVWAPAPARHEGGTPNLLGAVALAAAVQAHEQALLERLDAGLATVPGLSPLRVWGDAPERVGVRRSSSSWDPGVTRSAPVSAWAPARRTSTDSWVPSGRSWPVDPAGPTT